MIGEISFRSGEGATATVLAREPVRYLALERNALQKLLKADAEISHAIEDISTHSLEFKLARMNRTAQRIGSNLMLIKCQSHGAISSTALP
jgi:CRP-like cAMP-binding protein